MLSPRLLAATALAVALGLSWPARAANPPITSSNYAVDVFQGPVLAPVRVTGLAGAYAPIAEGVEGMGVNTAATAVRPLYSTKRVDYDLSLSFTLPGSLRNTDFDNNGSVGFTYRTFLFTQLGGLMQIGPWGFGVLASFQTYTVSEEQNEPRLQLTSGRLQAQGARSFLDGQLVLGVGLRIVTLEADSVDRDDRSTNLASMGGAGAEAGALWSPLTLPLRAALSVRAPVKGKNESDSPLTPSAEGNLIVDGRYLPSSIELPWEVEAGFAYQFGHRPLQLPWDDERAERYRTLPRDKVLLTASVLVTGPVNRGVGFEAFLAQRVEPSGRRAVVSPRVGVEVEPIANRLQLRAGSYLEPSRFDGISPRGHATAGAEVRLFKWTVFGLFSPDTSWRINAFGDVSRLYLGWGVGVGVWH